jgi:glycosyltransferase involved in cell wall biosynthesis
MSQPKKILVLFHSSVKAGFAMSALEKTFFEVCAGITENENHVFFSFNGEITTVPTSLPEKFSNIIRLDYQDNGTFESAGNYIRNNQIDYALCFDVQPHARICSMLRQNGIKKIVSYWGAPMSGEKPLPILILKKIELLFRRDKPDHFIFESEAMRRLSVHGRGIKKSMTSVIPTGIDETKFNPENASRDYLHNSFGIPANAKVVFYSGHMEKRKGVDVIIQSAIELIDNRDLSDVYFIICGNRPGEDVPFLESLKNHKAMNHVIFGGYRKDLHLIMPNCTLGVVASTGWDSFPMSTLEMAASGLPIVVSKLQGLVETLEDGVTGYTFEPGNHVELADKIQHLLANESTHEVFAKNARKRILNGYTRKHQINKLVECLNSAGIK